MRVLGFDLGIRPENPSAAALVVFGHEPRLLLACTLAPPPGAWPHRVQALHLAIHALIHRERPDLVAYEAPHGEQNPQTFRKLAALEGAILAACARCGAPALDVQPSAAKAALAGDGRADKAAMIAAARQAFAADLRSHEADALGVALAAEAISRRAALAARAAV